MVRASTAAMLIDLGFDVLEARSGPEALDLLAAEGSVDLLITDHLMPEMTGADLARLVQARHPDIRVLIASGYADVSGLPDPPRLEKPFRQADLVAKLSSNPALMIGCGEPASNARPLPRTLSRFESIRLKTPSAD